MEEQNPNPKINIKLFEEYREKEKQKNIFLHKLAIYFLLCVNLGLFVFIIVYKVNSRVAKTNQEEKEKEFDNMIEENKKMLLSSEKMQISLKVHLDLSLIGLASIIRSTEEFDFIFQNINKETIFVCFQSLTIGAKGDIFRKYCQCDRLLILIKTSEGERFGIYVTHGPSQSFKGNHSVDKDDKSFIVSLDKRKFYYQTNEPAYTFYDKGFFKIGNGDIVVEGNFYEGGTCSCGFPKNYGSSSDSTCEFINGRTHFNIDEMEVFYIM